MNNIKSKMNFLLKILPQNEIFFLASFLKKQIFNFLKFSTILSVK